MNASLLYLAMALCAQTQTRVTPAQIQAPPGAVRVLAFGADGKLALLTLGPGLVVEGGVIKAEAKAPVLMETRLTQDAGGTYQVPAGTKMVFRNGIFQSAADYKIEGTTLTTLGADPWDAADVVYAVTVAAAPPVSPVRP